MAVESKRGCGYRKVGGLYVIGGGEGIACGRLPHPLHVCPTCSQGIKQTRSWTWVQPAKLLADSVCSFAADGQPSPHCGWCPMGRGFGPLGEKAGLLWIGKSFYKTVADFTREAKEQGICRRIGAVPKDFVLGETWVLLAHPEAALHPILDDDGKPTGDEELGPGIFRVFKPTRIDKIVTESQAKDEDEMEKLRKRGITPVAVPDDDKDHRGTVYDKKDEKQTDMLEEQ